jgi:antitoxin CcdA
MLVQPFLLDAPKKAVNLSLNGDLLRLAKAQGLNISRIAEQALAQAVQESLGRRWAEENAEGIQAYNRRVEARGVFSDGLRSF